MSQNNRSRSEIDDRVVDRGASTDETAASSRRVELEALWEQKPADVRAMYESALQARQLMADKSISCSFEQMFLAITAHQSLYGLAADTSPSASKLPSDSPFPRFFCSVELDTGVYRADSPYRVTRINVGESNSIWGTQTLAFCLDQVREGNWEELINKPPADVVG
jgi:hypothetical protein